MIADANWGSAGDDDDTGLPRTPPRRERAEPPALQVKTQARAQPSTQQPDPESGRLEYMLQRLMERIDDSERRYGEALEDLQERLEGMSRQAPAHQGEHDDPGTELESVEARARLLADRLREADRDYMSESETEPRSDIEQRISTFAEQMATGDDLYRAPADPEPYADEASEDSRPPQAAFAPEPQAHHQAHHVDEPGLDMMGTAGTHADADTVDRFGQEQSRESDAFEHRFSHLSEQFEGSLAATAAMEQADPMHGEAGHHPARPPEDSSEAPHMEALGAIEERLATLSGCFDSTAEQNRRLKEIEIQLARLVSMMEFSGDRLDAAALKAAQETVRLYSGDRDWAGAAERLEAIQQELRALNERSREMGERTVGTIDTMSDTLRSLAARVGPRDGGAGLQSAQFGGEPGPVPPEYLDAYAEPPSQPGASAAPVQPPSRPEAEPQPQAAAAPEGRPSARPPTQIGGAAEPEGGAAPPRSSASGDHNLIAAARRAAQAAAARAHEQPPRAGLLARMAALTSARPEAVELPSENRKPRRLLVFAAVALLIVSAVLLYGRLQTRPEPPSALPVVPEQTAPPARSAPETSGASEAAFADRLGETLTASSDMPRSLAAFAPAQPSDLEPDPRLGLALPGTSIDLDRPGGASHAAAKPARLPEPPAKPAPAPDPTTARLAELPEAIGPSTLRRAAARGDAPAQFEIAARFAAGQGVPRDFAKASRWYERAAAQGLAPAQFRLASLYERGQGVAPDAARAKLWYARAAEQGNVNAMHNLAVMHTGSDGDGPDYPAAAKWFERAAAHGLADSQFNLGILYENGLGVRKNLLESYKWLRLAAARGDAEAERRGALLKARLSPGDIEQAEAAARHWSPAARDKAANSVPEPSGGWARAGNETDAAQPDAAVMRAQTLLNALGYDAGPADGIIGPRTRGAIRAFEQRAGFAPTGEVTRDLLSALRAYAG